MEMPGFAASPKAGLDMQAVEQLNNPNDINKLLHESLATERTIDAGLDQLLGRRGQLQDELVSLTSFSGEVSCVEASAGLLCGNEARLLHL